RGGATALAAPPRRRRGPPRRRAVPPPAGARGSHPGRGGSRRGQSHRERRGGRAEADLDGNMARCHRRVPADAGPGRVWPGPTAASTSMLEESLGPDANRVRFGDAQLWYRRLGTTIPGLARHLDEATAAAGHPLRVVAENPFAERRPREYQRYESMTNVALSR